VATKRILVVKDFLIEEHLLPPAGCRWSHREWKQQLRRGLSETRVMELHMATHKFDQQEWDTLGRESMEILFPERVVVLQESIGFFDQLIANPHYRDLWDSLGIQPADKLAWIGLVTSQFLSRPTTKLSFEVERLRRRTEKGSLSEGCLVQFRTFYDVGSPNLKVLSSFLEELERFVRSLSTPPRFFYVATDSNEATSAICDRISGYGRVIPSPTRVVHTGGMHVGWEDLLERGLRKLFRREFYFVDWWSWLPSLLRPRPHTGVVAEWFLMGELGTAVSTFTSFSVYAMARTGNRSRLLKFFPDTGRLRTLESADYGF